MLKLDLHVHTWRSRDCQTRPQAIIEAAQAAKLDGLAITDHNTIRGALELADLVEANSSRSDNALAAGMPCPRLVIIIGEEIKTTEGEIIGLFLQQEIPPRLSPAETVAAIHAQGGLVIVPHPCDCLRHSALHPAALSSILGEVDILETANARVTLARDNARAAELSRAHGLPASAGSDAHTPQEIGRAYVEMPDFRDAADFRQQLARGRVTCHPSPFWIHFLSTWAKNVRALSKRSL
jgi:hypothetical protein